MESGTYNIVQYDLVDHTGTLLLASGGSVITNLAQADGTLYFTLDGQLMKLPAGSADAAAIGSVRAGSINVIGSWVYYSNLDENETIWRITADGQYNQQLFDIEHTCCITSRATGSTSSNTREPATIGRS